MGERVYVALRKLYEALDVAAEALPPNVEVTMLGRKQRGRRIAPRAVLATPHPPTPRRCREKEGGVDCQYPDDGDSGASNIDDDDDDDDDEVLSERSYDALRDDGDDKYRDAEVI